MKTQFYLNVSRNGAVNTRKSRGSTAADEVSILMTLELPNSLFIKPQIVANVTVPDEAANPTMIKADVADNIKEAIEGVSGLNVTLTVQNPGESEK